MYQGKSQTRHEPLWPILYGAALIRYNLERRRKVTRAVLKRACLCIANAGGNFEQEAM
jgi:hypothetical protein